MRAPPEIDLQIRRDARMKLKGFLAGLAGGAVAAAVVVLLLVFVFDLGQVNKTVVQATPQTAANRSRPPKRVPEIPPICLTSLFSANTAMSPISSKVPTRPTRTGHPRRS